MDSKQKNGQKLLEYMWLLAVGNQPYQGLKRCQTDMVSTASSMEPTESLFLNTIRWLTVPQTSCALLMTASAVQNNFLE